MTMSSQIEEDMMILCHKAYDDGVLLEKPLGSADDMKIWIGIQPWSGGHETFTVPDQTFKEAQILTYFDGHPHYSMVRSKRDDAVNCLLTGMGWTVLRFLYRRNTKKLRLIFLQSIIETVNKKIKLIEVK